VSTPRTRSGRTYPWWYDDFVAAITDRRHPRHRERREWVGDFDPGAFDPTAATEGMRKVTG
jgi:hypothetical protein